MKTIVTGKELKKKYITSSETIEALKGVSFELDKGEIVALMGPSGSGKTTLLNLIGCLDRPSSGSLMIQDKKVSDMDYKELIHIRRQYLGFVFQDNHLIPTLTALENVNLPGLFTRGRKKADSKSLLDKVGLGDRMKHLPKQLSGGQNQRVAIARALVNSPSLILADEPTGRLDMEMKLQIFQLFRELASEGISILLATHDREIAQLCDRILCLKDGLFVQDSIKTSFEHTVA